MTTPEMFIEMVKKAQQQMAKLSEELQACELLLAGPGSVSEEVREKVLKCMRESGYIRVSQMA